MTGWDAVVLGAGPAGSTVAAALAGRGRRVLVVDRATFPRYAVGGSLSPAAHRALDALGVGPAVRGVGFVAKPGATFAWGTSPAPWSIYYGQPGDAPVAAQVRRPEFDHILLRHAAACGAVVREGCRATGVSPRPDGGTVTLRPDDGPDETVETRWVVDATGRNALLGRTLGLLEFPDGLDHEVVWSEWSHCRSLLGVQRGNSVFVGRGDRRVWFVPLDLDGGLACVGVLAPHRDGSNAADPAGAPATADRLDTYVDTVTRCEVVGELLSGATHGPVRLARARAHVATRAAGPGFLLVGDAAGFVDPILTPGVQHAVEHGLLAASTLDTALADPASAASALGCYDRACRQQYDTFVWLCRNLYRAARPAAAAGPPGQGSDGGERDRFTFLSTVSGLPVGDLPAALGGYLAARARALVHGAQPVVFGEEEGFAFLTRRARDQRCRAQPSDPPPDGTVRLAAGARLGEDFFLPSADGGPLERREAVTGRFGDRFAATPPLRALFALLDGGAVPVGRAAARLCRELGVTPRELHDWLGLLAEHGIVEWGPGAPAAAGPARSGVSCVG